jgi:hypothetical protein
MRGGFWFLVALSLSGCAVTHPYPICYFNSSPVQPSEQNQVESDISSVVKKYTGDSESPAFSPDHRWVIVKATGAWGDGALSQS